MQKKYKRTRPIVCTFCVSEEENEKILEKIKLSGMTKQEYFLHRALDDDAIVCRKVVSDKTPIIVSNGPQIAHELQKVGTNLNQAVTSLNKICKYFNGDDMKRELNLTLQKLNPCLDDCKNAFEKILEIGRPT
ncbi:MAG: hypothetical protein LUC17_03065 [Oscillospiraceae bacterium]|nr:hypothetical protein [Oscillospiraceae bacterium]